MHKMISALLQRKYFVCNIPIPLKANSNEVKINRTLLVCGTGQIKAKCMMYNNCVFLRRNVNHYNAYFCIIHHCNTLTKCVDFRILQTRLSFLKYQLHYAHWHTSCSIASIWSPYENTSMLLWNKILALKWGKEPEVNTGK